MLRSQHCNNEYLEATMHCSRHYRSSHLTVESCYKVPALPELIWTRSNTASNLDCRFYDDRLISPKPVPSTHPRACYLSRNHVKLLFPSTRPFPLTPIRTAPPTRAVPACRRKRPPHPRAWHRRHRTQEADQPARVSVVRCSEREAQRSARGVSMP